ncbi:MAG: four helix bundle protein [Bacteroidaceae bacterium]|nr:four helix bundle protein [Bacteroidaceae bacterium]
MFEPSKSFTDLIVWQKAHQFVLETYKVTRNFPVEERFALCSQFQRAAISIPANIAEGYKKLSKADKLRFLNISQGSLEECRYYIILSRDLSYINIKTYNELIGNLEEISKLLNSYIRGVVNKQF